jgi:hypothetical protein
MRACMGRHAHGAMRGMEALTQPCATRTLRRGAAAAVIVYDITSADSLTRAKAWVKELQRQGNPNMIMALAGRWAYTAGGGGDRVQAVWWRLRISACTS